MEIKRPGYFLRELIGKVPEGAPYIAGSTQLQPP